MGLWFCSAKQLHKRIGKSVQLGFQYNGFRAPEQDSAYNGIRDNIALPK